jgi:hypothetical protein
VDDGRLYAAPFEVSERRLTGPAIALPDTVRQEVLTLSAQIAVARNGTVAFASGANIANSRLIASDLNGKADTLSFPRAAYVNSSFSPDARRVAAVTRSSAGSELWIMDVESGQSTRLFVSPYLLSAHSGDPPMPALFSLRGRDEEPVGLSRSTFAADKRGRFLTGSAGWWGSRVLHT